ncbi:hypothetical protein B0H14DRAFT_3744322 [Mycena olivaceomarginata]|nr:hypothetical protein B0H14DRAFT_3744322 [Mycena olivaceomarginata]
MTSDMANAMASVEPIPTEGHEPTPMARAPIWFRAGASCTGQSNWGSRDSDSDFNGTTKGGANWRLRETSSTKRTSSAERSSKALFFAVPAIVRQHRFTKKLNTEERVKQGEGVRTASEECTSHQKVLVRVLVFMIEEREVGGGGKQIKSEERREVEDENICTYPAVMAFDPNQAFKDTGRWRMKQVVNSASKVPRRERIRAETIPLCRKTEPVQRDAQPNCDSEDKSVVQFLIQFFSSRSGPVSDHPPEQNGDILRRQWYSAEAAARLGWTLCHGRLLQLPVEPAIVRAGLLE